jgi:hypothetical protein
LTIANDIIFLALRNGNINGVGQTPMPDDVNDSFRVLNAMIAEWNLERLVQVNREPVPPFPDLTTDVPYWTPFEHVLLTTMAVRLRQIYSLPPVQLDVQLAVSAVAAWSAINLQKTPAPAVAADDGTGFGVIFLALRAAGRVADKQGVLETSQDVTDAHSILNEMLDEWNRERSVKVIPGTLPTVTDLSAALSLSAGQKNAVVLGLAVRLRDWFGAEIPKPLLDRAERALALIQAINLQQTPAPSVAHDDGTGYGILFLALRAAGRVNDSQGVAVGSQDVSDAASLMNEMLDEWRRARTVRVIPGTIPNISNLSSPVALEPGMRNAIVLNLAVRLRDAFGAEVPKQLLDRAALALELVQAINQQQTPKVWGGAPETVGEALFLALRMAGRINDQQSVSEGSKDVSDAFTLLMAMMAQWQRMRWLVWAEVESSVISTGKLYYTVGLKQDFNIGRPDKIHAAFVRLKSGNIVSDGAVLEEQLPFPLGASPSFMGANPVDIPLTIVEAKEDWAHISIKDLRSIPSAVFYDSVWPVGRAFFWPVPPANTYELHLITKTSLPSYEGLDDPLAMPPEYTAAIIDNLACRIIVASGGQISRELAGQARASLETVRMTNAQIPLLGMPAALTHHRGDVSSWVGRGLNQAWTTGGGSVLG